jgi:hypothetical protein
MEEMKRKREAERRRFAELGKDVTGRGAETVRLACTSRPWLPFEEGQRAATRAQRVYPGWMQTIFCCIGLRVDCIHALRRPSHRVTRSPPLLAAPIQPARLPAPAQVYRDKEGRAVSREEFQEQQAKARKKAEYEAERDLAWGGGLQQRQEAEARAEEMRREAAKPFARCAMLGCAWRALAGLTGSNS